MAKALGIRKPILALAMLTLASALIAPDVVQYWQESHALSVTAQKLSHGAITTHKAALRISHAVRQRVAPTVNGSFYRVDQRPALRHTAWETWSHGEGQCGEGARLIVNLLRAVGIPATRINLIHEATGFYHTAVAYFADGDW